MKNLIKYVAPVVLGALLSALVERPIDTAIDRIVASMEPASPTSGPVVLERKEPKEPKEPREEETKTAVKPKPARTGRPDFAPSVSTGNGVRTYSRILTGTDGEYAHVEISVLDAENYWPIGESGQIMCPGEKRIDFFDFFNSSGLRKRVERAQDIVAIGTASCELEIPGGPGKQREVQRAEDRARQLISWIRQLGSVADDTHLYMVNLGRFEDPDCPRDPYETRYQRNSVLVSVLYKENVSDKSTLGNLIREALQEEEIIGDLGRYSGRSFQLMNRS